VKILNGISIFGMMPFRRFSTFMALILILTSILNIENGILTAMKNMNQLRKFKGKMNITRKLTYDRVKITTLSTIPFFFIIYRLFFGKKTLVPFAPLEKFQIVDLNDYNETLKRLELPNILAQDDFREIFEKIHETLETKSSKRKFTIKEILSYVIIGDSIGAAYEFEEANENGTNFPWFSEKSGITDDSVLTFAITDAVLSILEKGCNKSEKIIELFKCKFLEFYQLATKKFNRRPGGYLFRNNGGFGGRFSAAIKKESFPPSDSCGNGSAMRSSFIAHAFKSLEEALVVSDLSALHTHRHKDGRLGAIITVLAIWLAKHGYSQSEIKTLLLLVIPSHWQGSSLCETNDFELLDGGQWEISQKTIGPAIVAFIFGKSFEDVIRRAVSYGGDTDTMAAIAASIAGPYFGKIPEAIQEQPMKRFEDEYPLLYQCFEGFSERYEKLI
jgi:ADP-ribosylglycohydrolase